MPSVIPDFRTLRSSLFQNISSATEIGFPGVALCFVATAGPLGDGPFPTGARRQRGPLRAVGSGAFSVNPSRLGGDDTAQPPRRAGDLPKPDAGTLSYSNPGEALFDQPPPPVLPMLAYVAVLYGQEPPDTSSSELSLSASEVVEIWEVCAERRP